MSDYQEKYRKYKVRYQATRPEPQKRQTGGAIVHPRENIARNTPRKPRKLSSRSRSAKIISTIPRNSSRRGRTGPRRNPRRSSKRDIYNVQKPSPKPKDRRVTAFNKDARNLQDHLFARDYMPAEEPRWKCSGPPHYVPQAQTRSHYKTKRAAELECAMMPIYKQEPRYRK